MMKLCMLIYMLAIVVASLICCSSMYHDLVIQVSEQKGNDNKTCLIAPDSICQSLEFIFTYLQNYSRNITILLDSMILLRNEVTLNNSEFLTIKGRHKSSKIICTAKCKQSGHGGILFYNAHYLMLSNITITSCCGTSNMYHATLMLYACSDITIRYFSIHKSTNGSALVLINPQGVININTCIFTKNGRQQRLASNTSFAGGIHLQFSERVQTNVTIRKCRFQSNIAPRYDSASLLIPTDWKGNSIGGGMCIALLEGTLGVNIQILNSIFHNNKANWGGGLCLYLQKYAHKNYILVFNSTFMKNHGNVGGGGVQVRIGEQESGLGNYTIILFKKVTFSHNTARFGGGTSINAMFISNATETESHLQFINCSWFNNYGQYSPAVDLSPSRFQQSNQGYLPIPLFKDIIVIDNHVLKPKLWGHYHVIQGVFVITRFFARFQGLVIFKRNWYSALYLTNGRAIFDRYSHVIFHSNRAIRGGAIAIHGFSGIILNDNSQFQFINNSATNVGGGIFYASSDPREYLKEDRVS